MKAILASPKDYLQDIFLEEGFAKIGKENVTKEVRSLLRKVRETS